jgi:hypothetical protein
MAGSAGRSGAALVFVIIGLAMTLGFHWIWMETTRGYKMCVLAKDQLGFKDTFIQSSGEALFFIQHPIMAAQVSSGRGWCVPLTLRSK